jgi:copper chaperone CopZ
MLRSTLLLAVLAIQGASAVAPVRHPTCVRYYGLDGDVKADVLRKTLAGLGWKDTEARVVVGPTKAASRPKARFLALELPARVPAKDVEAALKKISPHAEELAWTAFQGKVRTLPAILGYSPLECVVGMDNDVHWFDLTNGRARFFFTPGKFDAKGLREKFEKLYQPFNAGDLGDLVHETVEWHLAEPLDATAAKTAEKAIAKIPGLRKVKIDVATRILTADVEQDGLRGAAGSAPAADSASAASAVAVPAGNFLVDDILEALANAKVAVEGAAAAEEKR